MLLMKRLLAKKGASVILTTALMVLLVTIIGANTLTEAIVETDLVLESLSTETLVELGIVSDKNGVVKVTSETNDNDWMSIVDLITSSVI